MHLDLPGARVERSSDGQAFLFEERYGFVYLLNDVGAFLAERLLSGDEAVDDLVKAIQDRFDVPSNVNVADDVDVLLDALRSYGLLA
jgi:hypothetical protein